MTDILRELENITAKRNTAMTIIESTDIDKTLQHVRKQISAIKHQSKRIQLLKIITILEKYVKDGNKKIGIFCIAEQTNGDIYYNFIDCEPDRSEYYYDDIFNVLKISTILLKLKTATDKEINDLIVRASKGDNEQDYRYVHYLNDEIDVNIDSVRTIYFMTSSTYAKNIPLRWIDAGKEVKLILDRKFDDSSPLSRCWAIAI